MALPSSFLLTLPSAKESCERTTTVYIWGDDGMQSIILWVVAERQPVVDRRKFVNYRSYAVAIGQATMNRVAYIYIHCASTWYMRST